MRGILNCALFTSVIYFSCSSPADNPVSGSVGDDDSVSIQGHPSTADKIYIYFKKFTSSDYALGWFYFDDYGQQKKVFAKTDRVIIPWKIGYNLAFYTIPQTSFYPVSPGDTLIITKTDEYPYYPQVELLNGRLSPFELNFPAFLSGKNSNSFEYSLRKIPNKLFPLDGSATQYYKRATQLLDSCFKARLINKEYETWIKESLRYSYYDNMLNDGKLQDLVLPSNIFSGPNLSNLSYRLFVKKYFFIADLKKKADYVKGYAIAKEKYSGEVRDYLLFTSLLQIVHKFPDDKSKYIARFNSDSESEHYKSFIETNMFFPSKREMAGEDILLSSDKERLAFDSLILSLKGNLIYIDVWASWCKPCREEMPKSKTLADFYTGKRVRFIYLSIDQNFGSWLEGARDEKLTAGSYFLVNATHSSFKKKYNIEAIPRYILLDKNGKIIDANAPRPGDNKLKELINVKLSNGM